ncbi:MAG: hypothetical protein ACTHMI_14000 [Mucilaginibacter sp.]
MKNLEQLTLEDLSFIKESLKYTKLKFEEYQDYPSYDFKQGRIEEAADVLNKVSEIIKANRK